MNAAMFNATDTASYDRFMGRFSTKLAPLFADFAGIAAGQHVLDVGAGTGALTAELVARDADVSVAEPSPSFAEALPRRFPGLDVRRTGAEELPWADETFDASLAQLVVTFMQDAPAGVAEMRRVVRRGGVVAICMWDIDGMEMLSALRQAQHEVDPGAASISTGMRYRTRAELEEMLGPDVETELLAVEAAYSDYDELWTSFAESAGPTAGWVRSLDDGKRAEARDELRRQVGEPQGPFSLVGRAWAARVRRA